MDEPQQGRKPRHGDESSSNRPRRSRGGRGRRDGGGNRQQQSFHQRADHDDDNAVRGNEVSGDRGDEAPKKRRLNNRGNVNKYGYGGGGGGGRGGHRYFDRNREYRNYNNRGDRNDNKKPRFDVGERLKEVDLGITEYIGNTEGFTGTIKERYNDFIVHEISLNGEIAKLTDFSIPPEPEEEIDVEELKKQVSEDIWEKLLQITDRDDVEIDVTDMDRHQRRVIHQIVKKMSQVYSETIDKDDKKLIVFSKFGSHYGTKHDTRKDWSLRGGDYCHFILHKCNMDTMDALNQLSRILRLKPSIFSYSGTKDKRARTTQWICAKKMNPQRISNAARPVKGMLVGNFKFEREPLKLGKLYGNRFTIALRNVTAPDDVIENGMASLRDNGFINYYGLQRFGTIASIPTHEIGKALLKGEWEDAVNLILKPREGEQDRQLAEARQIYQQTKDSRNAYDKLKDRSDKIEAKLLWGFNVAGSKNFQGALDNVPRNQMLMYIHAYQSKVWNEIVSRRIKEFGLKPIAGDLVYENSDAKDEFVPDDVVHFEAEDSETSISDEKTNVVEAQDENTHDSKKDSFNEANLNTDDSKTKEEKSSSEKEDDKCSQKSDGNQPAVKILTEEDLSKYTLADVVMPQPGWKVVYPPYAKDWFEEQLQKDGLTPELKQKNKKYTLSGSYRKILELPQNLTWNILRYNYELGDLVLSDLQEMRGQEPLKSDPEGKYKALVIEMSLKSSTYATMALREVLKCDTSSQTQAAQSAAFHQANSKQETETRECSEEVKQSSEASEAESIPHVENLELKDRNGDNECENKSSNPVANSTMHEDSEEAHSTLKVTSSPKDSSSEKILASQSALVEQQKHQVDPTNDSGLETSIPMST